MEVPPLRPTAVAVYVYRRIAGGVIEFLQIRRSAKARGHQASWQTVYGGIQENGGVRETAIEAAKRELREETGLAPLRMFQVEFLETFYFRPNDSVLLMPVFAVEVAAGDVITLNEEHDDYRWVKEDVVDGAFMWRTQREAISILLQMLRGGSQAMGFLEIPV